MKIVTFTIPGITCNHCIHTITSEISEIDGVQKVTAEIDSKQVEITFDNPATEEQIIGLLAEINYPPQISS